jgi:hypothetical protein
MAWTRLIDHDENRPRKLGPVSTPFLAQSTESFHARPRRRLSAGPPELIVPYFDQRVANTHRTPEHRLEGGWRPGMLDETA